ncbi:MAG: hypothetical protein AAF840_01730 [Bacteroidota bacterium]
MNDARFQFWRKWLTAANALTIGVGLLVAFAGNSLFFAAHNAGTEQVFFPEDGFSAEALQLKNWLFGIIGGTIVGFHLLMVAISENAFRQRERWAYLAMWGGMLSWFVIDSGLSYYYGAVHNILLINVVALILICTPLVFTRRVFYPAR